ncbi:MAG TPA: L-threonylcarbamoyladenylate synthase [Alphaproteobacteria bacterium]|jgi:L-threonylcarbamoyladenylate synthase|nr:L-threonylcarbamoyladenylate synthase [Alphaproteobacteria bacterium]
MSEARSVISPPTPDAIARAGALIRDGRLVAFPTETVYGLGADATNDAAVASVFEAKGRPRFNPLIIHFADAGQAAKAAAFDDRARELAREFWPGPLTLVLPRQPACAVSLLACAGLDTIAVRVPGHEVALALLNAAQRPLAAPSANPSGTVSPTTAAHVAASMAGKVAMILDGGPCRIGIESTVLDLSGAEAYVLRPGGIPAEAIESVIGALARPDVRDAARPRSPGLALRHYAPSLPLRLNASGAPQRPNEALLAFGPRTPSGYAQTLSLSPAGDLTEAAANLFAMLRALDTGRFGGIAVMPIPSEGLGAAINDRLKRAAEAPLAAPGRTAHMARHSPQETG